MKNSLAFLELKRKVALKGAVLEYNTTTTFQARFLQKVKYYRRAREEEKVLVFSGKKTYQCSWVRKMCYKHKASYYCYPYHSFKQITVG